MQIQTQIYEISLKGSRTSNEDAHDIIINLDKSNPKMKEINYYSIFDGHGSKRVSEFLFQNMSQFFMDNRLKYPINKQYVYAVYNKIQKKIATMPYAKNAGSTGL